MSTLRPQPTESDLAELFRLHGSVRYLDAFHFAQTFAAPEEWRDTRALILAGRLFSVWGDSARSNRLHFRAWRAAPQHPEAIYFHGLTIEWRHGPFEALRFLHEQRTHFEAPREPTIDHAWLWLRKARLLATFRDFEAAEVLVQRAEPLGASDPWFWVERSRLRQQQDRYADALADAEQAMAVQPNYRPAVETLVDLFMLLNRDADALALLHRCAAHMQSGSLAQTRALLHSELEQHAEALVALDQAVAWTPAADEANRRWFAARRADALRGLNRDAEAAEEARRAKHGFHDHVAERLRQPAPPDKPRRLLRVEFVRQHHMTCAPATLSALGSYWQRPIDHLALAQVICYDGTPDHEERHWAEANGWIVREFRVTWECSVALLKRGCPFTLTTVATRSAHLQAVVGCDERLGLLLIRDPYQRTHGECVGEAFLQGCASHGPRGMVLVPPERAELLAGIELPDAPLYDRWYRLRRALERHDRNAARAEAEALEAAAPGHLLALKAQRELASYDGHTLRRIETTRALLKLFPDDPNFLLDEAQLLRVAGHLGEWRERVEALGRRRPVNALFLREFVEMLGEDARRQPQALREARRVLRRFSTEPGNLRAFAGLLWSRKEFGLATEIYRLAACVGDKTESHWDTFFSASRHTQQVDKCIELLRQREARLGARSSQPVRTLFRAYETLDRTHEGFDALRRALELRPDDGELQLYAAENFGRFGRFDEAAKCIAAAANRVSASLWLRSNARLSEYRMDFAAALKFWREVLVLNPIDAGAHQAAAGLIATLEGRPAARRFLREACDQHPNHVSLHTTFLEWVRSEPPD